jgi:hypothetical protein
MNAEHFGMHVLTLRGMDCLYLRDRISLFITISTIYLILVITLILLYSVHIATRPIPVTQRSKVWVCGRSLAGIAGSNPTGVIDVCLL